jgi:hypothetical protein
MAMRENEQQKKGAKNKNKIELIESTMWTTLLHLNCVTRLQAND